MSQITKEAPIDARVVALNETPYYEIRKEHRRYIKAIRGVYLYDRNRITHCCEWTPSYWLIHLYDQVILSEAGARLSDAEQDRLYQEYESCPSDDHYFHCSAIDEIEAAAKPEECRYHVYGATGVSYEDSDYDSQVEGLCEHFRCNCVL